MAQDTGRTGGSGVGAVPASLTASSDAARSGFLFAMIKTRPASTTLVINTPRPLWSHDRSKLVR
ncbi:hypothetical protein ACFU8I_40880 [Streptomyces sp. NPDC057540]|uniref:hypothetical protein n=1 Tax=Streptomyces sp. NPDC057540 TaxID=3346160 RepID=UPI00369C1E77